MKIIVAGGREFNDYSLLKNTLDNILKDMDLSTVEIVSGAARGADSLGERYAKENNISLVKFTAMWRNYGNSAGYRRNYEMAEYADTCLCFWDKESKGTKHMIDIAKKLKLNLYVVNY